MIKITYIYMIVIVLLVSLCTPLYCENDIRGKAETLFIEAQKELANGNEQSAEELLKESLKVDPSFTSAIWQLAQIYQKQGKLEFARELMLRGLKIDPGATWARGKLKEIERSLCSRLMSQASNFIGDGEYSKAIPKLSLYLGIRPGDIDALTLLARSHLAMGNLEVARGYLIDALKIDPTNNTVALLLDRVDEKINESSINAMIAKAKKLLANYSPETGEETRKILISILDKDPENNWAKEKLNELNLVIEQKQREDEKKSKKSKIAEQGAVIASNAKAISSIVLDKARENLTNIILIIFSILLILNLRRKVTNRDFPLEGSLSLIPILDIISLINSNLKTGRMVIHTSRTKGEIFFEKGEIVHARWKGYDGKKAFHKLMEVKSGRFAFINHLPKIKHTINEPLSLLLLSMPSQDRSMSEPDVEEKVEAEELFTR